MEYDNKNCTQTGSKTSLEMGLLETILRVTEMKDKLGLKGKSVGYHN